jgi:ABC-2 type transport system ATP-binding protein
MSAPVIVVQNLTKRFPVRRGWLPFVRRPLDRRWKAALDGVTLEVGRGEALALLGPNGAGKTTLLRILSTLILPTSGRATVCGHDVTTAPQRVRRAIGYCVDTERTFYYRLTGIQNLNFFATLNNLTGPDRSARVAEVLETVKLDGAAAQPFMTYSKGMQQRLGLARALLTDPSVVLLDEPTRSLDPAAAAEFRGFLRSVLVDQLGKTVILVTHSLEEARECATRVAVMDGGRIVESGRWSEVEEGLRARGFVTAGRVGEP